MDIAKGRIEQEAKVTPQKEEGQKGPTQEELQIRLPALKPPRNISLSQSSNSSSPTFFPRETRKTQSRSQTQTAQRGRSRSEDLAQEEQSSSSEDSKQKRRRTPSQVKSKKEQGASSSWEQE